MMDFNERVIPGVSSNFMFMEAKARYEFAKKYVKRRSRIIDLGSGTGYGAPILFDSSTKYLGLDIDQEAVTFSQKKYSAKNITFKKGNITTLKFPKESFDFACSFEVIEHLKNPIKFLYNVKKVLKKDGVFVLSTPNGRIISPKGGVGSPYHVKEFNYNELNTLLKKKFKHVEIFGQTKSKKAIASWTDFLESQKARENVAKSDRFGLRKLIPKSLKEKIWKYLGAFFGRSTQEGVETKDFPITKNSVRLAYYFVAVCRK